MKNLIKFNAERLKKDKFFYVLILSVTLLSILSGFQDTVQGNISSGYEGFIKSYSDIFMSFFIAVYCGYFIGSDFSSKIIQRQISSGISRKDIVISKLIVLMIASFIIVNLYPIIVGIMGSLKYGFLPIKDYNNILEIVRIIIISNLCFMSLTSIYSLLGFATQSIGEKIGVFILKGSTVLTLRDIRNYLVERGLASFKLPDEVQYVDQWPLTSVGKVDKSKLKQQMIK
ncbi:TPA: hypothetical protein ACIOWV_001202 [Streptococcus agalactiae]